MEISVRDLLALGREEATESRVERQQRERRVAGKEARTKI
jgi:hypothetical protein